ncbi:hypothetical protein HO133_003674 [Letharia lupina]|uniref:CMP/dCMP-type deaminase domain-containing protein n=1 Tax=Letharia lupina TaxID=560253 RepID=A0A8H6CAT4_9LECA|nr:uncharacterized protein HO133_003674 [Letharia lupina]KAF6219849.1 hypothetical protein HO133_003674 [Letharia lupina]
MGSPSSSTTKPSQPVNALRGAYDGEGGHLVSLPTKVELQSSCQTIEVFVATIPLKSASTVLKLVQAAIQDAAAANLQHLRKLVKPEHLPPCLRRLGEISESHNPATEPAGLPRFPRNYNGSVPNGYQTATFIAVNGHAEASQQPALHYLVCPTSVVAVEDLHTIFSSMEPSLGVDFEPHLRIIPVPLYPPSSEKQAKDWSQEYWPTVYKGGNPFGPHPALVSRALEDVHSRTGRCMSLARRAGEEVSLAAKGEPIGAVIVDRSGGEDASIIAVAGDARWHHMDKAEEPGSGNVTAHAVMRAIGMVARKRRAPLHKGLAAELYSEESDLDADRPLTPLESDVYTASTVARDGYLCLDLELYITHEPCVMCSMAILHSRFSRVIFGQRMLRTGGLTAVSQNNSGFDIKNDDQGLGYGLFWRQELNWRHLAWQWLTDDDLQTCISSQDVHI